MAAIVKLRSGNWRVQVRGKKNYVSNTFRRRADAEAWHAIDKGLDPEKKSVKPIDTFSDIIDLHVRDLQEVGKQIRRSKRPVLESQKIALGTRKIDEMNRASLIELGKKRAKAGAGPSTLSIDLSFIVTLLTHAAAIRTDRIRA